MRGGEGAKQVMKWVAWGRFFSPPGAKTASIHSRVRGGILVHNSRRLPTVFPRGDCILTYSGCMCVCVVCGILPHQTRRKKKRWRCHIKAGGRVTKNPRGKKGSYCPIFSSSRRQGCIPRDRRNSQLKLKRIGHFFRQASAASERAQSQTDLCTSLPLQMSRKIIISKTFQKIKK